MPLGTLASWSQSGEAKLSHRGLRWSFFGGDANVESHRSQVYDFLYVKSFLRIISLSVALSIIKHISTNNKAAQADTVGRCSLGRPLIIDSLTAIANSSSVLPFDSTGSCTTTLQAPNPAGR